eukprot:gb/GEZN01004767.1/.p1 GENE.gb/GEZN01004767.1/~~gb/GEZN01004767.1/.p1  ORF type:complete len:583 (-),score=85.67 gb/GEZN01004767.1/:124-1872(-)
MEDPHRNYPPKTKKKRQRKLQHQEGEKQHESFHKDEHHANAEKQEESPKTKQQLKRKSKKNKYRMRKRLKVQERQTSSKTRNPNPTTLDHDAQKASAGLMKTKPPHHTQRPKERRKTEDPVASDAASVIASENFWNPGGGLSRNVASNLAPRLRLPWSTFPEQFLRNPKVEKARAAALQALRDRFASLCQAHGVKKTGATGVFEKFHFVWLHEAGDVALREGKLCPEEPLLPSLTTSASLKTVRRVLLEELNIPEAKSLATALTDHALVIAAKLSNTIRTIQVEALEGMSSMEEVSVVHGQSRSLELRHGDTTLRINRSHYAKLRTLFSLTSIASLPSSAVSSGSHESSFHRALFCLLLRYKAIRGPGFQAALSGIVFDCLQKEFEVNFECFASPLNCRYRFFSSAFPDTDSPFGSLGSFFALQPIEGSFQINPPFVGFLVSRLCLHLEALMRRAEAKQKALTFVLVVGANSASRRHVAWTQLQASSFKRAETLIKLHEHGYFEGEQHISKESTRLSTCDSGVFVWQTSAAMTQRPVEDEVMKRVVASFRSSVPHKLRKTPKLFKQRAKAKKLVKAKRAQAS